MWVLLLKVTVGSVTAAFLFVAVVYDFENISLYRFKSGTSELLFLLRSDFRDSERLKLQQNALVSHVAAGRSTRAETHKHTHRTFSRRQQLDNATTQRRSSPRFHTAVVNSPVTVNTCNFSRYVQCFCMKSDREAFVIFFFLCLFLFWVSCNFAALCPQKQKTEGEEKKNT